MSPCVFRCAANAHPTACAVPYNMVASLIGWKLGGLVAIFDWQLSPDTVYIITSVCINMMRMHAYMHASCTHAHMFACPSLRRADVCVHMCVDMYIDVCIDIGMGMWV